MTESLKSYESIAKIAYGYYESYPNISTVDDAIELCIKLISRFTTQDYMLTVTRVALKHPIESRRYGDLEHVYISKPLLMRYVNMDYIPQQEDKKMEQVTDFDVLDTNDVVNADENTDDYEYIDNERLEFVLRCVLAVRAWKYNYSPPTLEVALRQ